MKAYLITTGALFALLALAHLRMLEGVQPLEPLLYHQGQLSQVLLPPGVRLPGVLRLDAAEELLVDRFRVEPQLLQRAGGDGRRQEPAHGLLGAAVGIVREVGQGIENSRSIQPLLVSGKVTLLQDVDRVERECRPEYDSPTPVAGDRAAEPLVAAQLSVAPASGGPRLFYECWVLRSAPPGSRRVRGDAVTGEVVAGEVRRSVFDGEGRVFNPNPVVTLRDGELRDRDNAAEAVPESAYSTVALRDLSGGGTPGDPYTLTGPYVTTRGTPDRAQDAAGRFHPLLATALAASALIHAAR